MAEIFGVKMPQPGTAASRVLTAAIPEYGSVRNPCDVTAQVINDQDSPIACCTALLEDREYCALLLPQEMTLPELTPGRVPLISELSHRTGQQICIISHT